MSVLNKTPQQARASDGAKTNREKMMELYQQSPLPIHDMVVNFPLYTRSSAVAKLLYINELYQHITQTPGVIMEFGVWWGANMALFESLRAVYEPYNYTRKVIGFDTFEGYQSISEKDGTSDFINNGNYDVTKNYTDHLSKILDCHQNENVMANVKKYELVKGDATQTIKTYLDHNPETIISLAYFDMQLYQPTKECLERIKPHLTKGSLIAMDEINCHEFPGETVALQEVFGLNNIRLIRSKILPDRAYFIIE
jgi:hypothetical protein